MNQTHPKVLNQIQIHQRWNLKKCDGIGFRQFGTGMESQIPIPIQIEEPNIKMA